MKLKNTFAFETPKQWLELLVRKPDFYGRRRESDMPFSMGIGIADDVHDSVLRSFKYVPDKIKDVWGSGKTVVGSWSKREILEGDCDDFAVRCIEVLTARGAEYEDCSVVWCKTENGEDHLVASLNTDSETIILDCRKPTASVVNDKFFSGYKWLAQSIPGSSNWSYVHV